MTWLLCGLLALFVAPNVMAPGSPETITFAVAGHLVFILLCAILFWSAAVAAPSGVDKIYYRISIGSFVWCIAVVLRNLESNLHQPAYGTVADTFWVAGYLLLAAGVYAWFYRAGPTRKQILLILLILGCASVVIVTLFLKPLMENPDRSDVLKTLDLFYLTLDLAMAGLLCVPASKTGARGSRMMLAGILFLMASDIVFIHSPSPGTLAYRYLDIPYSVGDFLLALAGNVERAAMVAGRTKGKL